MRNLCVILALFLPLAACKKYEEDEFISLRGPEKRLKIWSPFNSTEVTFNGNDLDWEVTIGYEKDMDFRFHLIDESGDEFEGGGDWHLSDDEEHIILSYNNGGRERWRIEKLHRKNLIMSIEGQQGGELRFDMEGH